MRIITRKKGEKTYHYLQHSYRENGKVVTKERYLGIEIPRDIEMVKLELRKASQKEVFKKFKRIKEHFQKEWHHYPESIKEKEKMEVAVAFTYNSNAIEGSTITLHDAWEILQDRLAPHKPISDIKETEAHCRVFLRMLDSKELPSESLLLKWHRDLFGETKKDIAGKFREYPVRVGSYRAPDWKSIKKGVGELMTFIGNAHLHPVELAALAHYRFEKIHPFGDGNGRIGRLLMNNILWHHHYPMLIIEHKKRRAYYKALEKEEDGFLHYFFRRYLAVHKKRYAGL